MPASIVYLVLCVSLRSPADLNPRRAGRLLVLPQIDQQLPELRLPRSRRTTARSLSCEIHELRDTIPARAPGRGVLPVLEELLGLAPGLRHRLLFLVVVVVVEVVDGAVRGFDGLGFLVGADLVAVLEGEIAALAPLADDFGFFFVGV